MDCEIGLHQLNNKNQQEIQALYSFLSSPPQQARTHTRTLEVVLNCGATSVRLSKYLEDKNDSLLLYQLCFIVVAGGGGEVESYTLPNPLVLLTVQKNKELFFPSFVSCPFFLETNTNLSVCIFIYTISRIKSTLAICFANYWWIGFLQQQQFIAEIEKNIKFFLAHSLH